ncbi:glycosyltransferase family 1 protein [Corallococcus praedator]|uniref:Glycosyltransferase family 1 protein n=1 Tax=Corallococcus praedator TaxID=2316724 RepID=A0ABX9QF22_9BACT|nr:MULTISPECIES: glycosyltransferase [Corallococcus]RKH27907.1 glycosyltransferase family 1 protein [Corallococcus sp. CA031C]RKI03243.1 glycosyltransferase family 1 protein [Corallococcus praedator]
MKNELHPAAAARPTRVAHVMYGLEMGGLEQLVVRLSEHGRSRGIDSVVLALGPDGPVRELLQRANVPTVWLGGLAGMTPTAIRRLAQEVDAFGADVVHGHDVGPWLNAVATRTLRPRTSVLGTFHQTVEPQGKLRPAAMAAAVFTQSLVACGSEVRASLERWSPKLLSRVVTIENGVPLTVATGAEARRDARERLGLAQDATVVGYLGRLSEEKGPDLLVDAFLGHFAQETNTHLVMIGPGPMEASLRERAAASPLAGRVHFTGALLDASKLLPAFDVYVQPSRREGRSLSLLEAMAVGLPTVSHTVPAIREVHRDGQTALLVPTGDVKALADAVKRLTHDPELRARLGSAAKLESQRYSLANMVDAYAKLYRGAAAHAQA